MQILKIDILFSFRWNITHIPKNGTVDAVHRNYAQPITSSTILKANLTGRRCMVVISVGKTCTVSIRCECNKQYVRLVRGCINGTPRKERGHSSELSETVKRRFRTSKTLGFFTTTAIFRKFVALKVWTFWEWRVRLARALVLLPVLYQQILTLASSFATSQQMLETLVLTNQ